jgi:hypothetical protein
LGLPEGQEAWASRLGLSFAFAAAGPCRTGAVVRVLGVVAEGRLRPTCGGLGAAAGGAGGSSDGGAEIGRGPTGGGLGELSVAGVVVRGTLRAETGLTGSEGEEGGVVRGTLTELAQDSLGLGQVLSKQGRGRGGGGAGVARPVSSVWSSWRVATWLSVRGARGTRPMDWQWLGLDWRGLQGLSHWKKRGAW